ncbi:MAG: GSCFA domain-containing protein [Bacteroidetes bacterium]|nr:GSCFA domain-containing protein [Bacteroidota bacterium]
MNFRTELNIAPSFLQLNYFETQIFMGSCFSENIGKKTEALRFNTLINPFGIVFNPFSISKNILRTIEKRAYTEEELGFYNGLFYSFDHHSSFSHSDKNVCLQKINEALFSAHEFLRRSKVLFITFGSAWVYLKDEKAVANCHKIPNHQFEKQLLQLENITSWYNGLLLHLKKINPHMAVVFTVSPVRHLKDGFIENQRSKAILLEAVHRIVEQNKNAHYFPAYELVMDDLRDYRFYGKDLLHLTEVGVEYVWQKFVQAYYSEHTQGIMKEVDKLNLFLNHRVMNEEEGALAVKKEKAVGDLKGKYPFLNL